MFGPSLEDPEMHGIIPRSISFLFQQIENDNTDTVFTMQCSFLEIYKEKVKDLLEPSSQMVGLFFFIIIFYFWKNSFVNFVVFEKFDNLYFFLIKNSYA